MASRALLAGPTLDGASRKKAQITNERLKAKLERATALLNADGTVTPTEGLPAGLLTEEGRGGVAANVQEALVVDTVARALKLARQQARMTAKEVAGRRELSKGRLSQLENGSLNPTVGTLAQHADALGYDITVVLTPRASGQTIEIALPGKTE